MIRIHATGLAAAALIAIAGPAAAQGVLTEKNISAALAVAIAQGAVDECLAKGYRVSATVTDRAGVPKALVRADGAGPHTVDASRMKAYTSVSFRGATGAFDEGWRNTPAAAGLRFVPGVLAIAGGLPIKVGDDTIGAVGVGGAPGGHLDEQCAQAAIAKVQSQLQ